jgi:hypothetical protein
MGLYCKKCLTGRTGDVLGELCKSSGCDGVIEEEPARGTLVNRLPEPMSCPRRGESFIGSSYPRPDYWEKFKSNGNRVCSYCGSLHPEDMFQLVKLAAEAPEDADYRSVVEIEPSHKNYKVYVQQPGVRNAMEGGIKFYMQHLPYDADGKLMVSEQQNLEYSKAVRLSRKRFDRHLASMYPIHKT